SGIPCWNNADRFDHQDNGLFGRPGLVEDGFRYDETLVRSQLHRFSTFEVDEKNPLESKEKLVFIIMLMPVVFALQNSQADHRIVDPAKRLIVPAIGALFDQ